MNSWDKFFDFMANECGCAVTEDGAVHCCECQEPVYEEDFDGTCPSCGCAIQGGDAVTGEPSEVVSYDERVKFVADMWRSTFDGDMTREDHDNFISMCDDFQVSNLDVLEEI